MSGFWFGVLCGAPAGAALAVLTGYLRAKAHASSWEVPGLTDSDRAVLVEEFTTHARAMQQQVARFADTLAGDDVVLRERLRNFEGHGGKP